MKQYRQTMIIHIDVLAESVEEATEIASDAYYDFDHFWAPDRTVIIPDGHGSDGHGFSPVNEVDN